MPRTLRRAFRYTLDLSSKTKVMYYQKKRKKIMRVLKGRLCRASSKLVFEKERVGLHFTTKLLREYLGKIENTHVSNSR